MKDDDKDNKKPYSPKITVTAGGKFNSIPEQKPKTKEKMEYIDPEEATYAEMLMYLLVNKPSVQIINNMSRFDNDCFGFIEDEDEYREFEYEIEEISKIRKTFNIPETPVLYTHVYDLPIDEANGENLLKGNIQSAEIIYSLTEKINMNTVDGDLHLHMIYLDNDPDNQFNKYKVFCSFIITADDNHLKSVYRPVVSTIEKLGKLSRVSDVRLEEMIITETEDEDGVLENRYLCMVSYVYEDSAVIQLV